MCGTVHSDSSRETAKFLFIYDDHRSRSGKRQITRVCRRVQPSFGVQQSGKRGFELAATQLRPGIANAEHWPEVNQLVGERLEPAQQHGSLSTLAHGCHCQLDQVRAARELL